MTTTPATIADAAVRDGSALAPWAEANAVATEDERIEAAVLRALAGPLPGELGYAVPLLRFANTDLPAIPLVRAVISPPRHDHRVCDRCERDDRLVADRLWIPAGASVVEVACCWRCKITLDWYGADTSTLVWS